jgi:hypothetical protein
MNSFRSFCVTASVIVAAKGRCCYQAETSEPYNMFRSQAVKSDVRRCSVYGAVVQSRLVCNHELSGPRPALCALLKRSNLRASFDTLKEAGATRLPLLSLELMGVNDVSTHQQSGIPSPSRSHGGGPPAKMYVIMYTASSMSTPPLQSASPAASGFGGGPPAKM